MLLENSTKYISLGWLGSVCAQSQPRSISLPCPDCGSQFLLKSKANAKGRNLNLLLGEIHKLKNFKWGIFHPQRTALRVTLCHLSTLTFYWFYLSQVWRIFQIIKIQVRAMWARGRCGGAKLPPAGQPHQNAYTTVRWKLLLWNPRSNLKNNDDPLSFCSITLNILFLSHGYMPQHGQIPRKGSLQKKCCLNPGLSHFHMNRLRGAEESEMRRMLVILKHSSALPAQLFDEERICWHPRLPVRSSRGGEKVKVVCAKQHRCLKHRQVRIRRIWFTALIQSHTGRGRGWLGDCNSPILSCCWERAPHQGAHSVVAKEQIVSLGCPWVWWGLSIWAQICIYGKKPLSGPLVIGRGEVVLHWKGINLD